MGISHGEVSSEDLNKKCVECGKTKDSGNYFEIYCGKQTPLKSEKAFRRFVHYKDKLVIVSYLLDSIKREWVCDECVHHDKMKRLSLIILSLIIFALLYLVINIWLITSEFWNWGWEVMFFYFSSSLIVFFSLMKFLWRYYNRFVLNSGYNISRKKIIDDYYLTKRSVKDPYSKYIFKYPDEWKKEYEHFGNPDK